MPAHLQRILVAEDDENTLRMISYYLASWEYQVVQARDGDEAAAALDGVDPPAIALIDWMMPGKNGVELCQMLRSEPDRPYTYVLLLTGKTNKSEVTAGLDAGADDYITKPCDMKELRARLHVGERIVALERKYAQQVVALRESLEQVQTLRQLLPICAWCKRVRDDEDYWYNIEEYLHRHAGTDFTHGICPHCLAGLRAGISDSPPH